MYSHKLKPRGSLCCSWSLARGLALRSQRLERAGEFTCAGLGPTAQLGRVETGSLEAAEKRAEELQSVSLPCLMCLQVPLKTDEASEMERSRKGESTSIKEERGL